MVDSARARLRKALRQERHSLSDTERSDKARQVARRVMRRSFFVKSKRIAFYFASDAELDPLTILFRAMGMGKHCYLPVLSSHRPDKVSFAPFHTSDVLVPNRWGILEPDHRVRRLVTPYSLDLVFVPLVGFDENCNRIGMGKGFYDRTFAYRRRLGFQRPKLVGLAYKKQKVDSIPSDSWDVPLDAVVSEEAIYRRGKFSLL